MMHKIGDCDDMVKGAIQDFVAFNENIDTGSIR